MLECHDPEEEAPDTTAEGKLSIYSKDEILFISSGNKRTRIYLPSEPK